MSPAGRRISPALALFLGSLLVYNANLREISSGDTVPTRLLPVSLIQDGALTLDRFFQQFPAGGEPPYWARRVGGHYVSTYPVLPALLAVPIYLLPVTLLPDGGNSWVVINLLSKLAATVIAALSALLVYLTLRRLVTEPAAVGITMVYAFGTSTWSVSSQGLWGHGPAQLFLALALYCAARGAERAALLPWVGLAGGFMVASRLTTGFVAVALIAYVFATNRRQGVLAFCAFAMAALPLVAYNLSIFGSLQGGYANVGAFGHGIDGLWSTPLGAGMVGLLVSPSRGLFIYSPILAGAFVGLLLSLMDRRRLFHYLAAGFVASLVMLAKNSFWWGGHSFGPRYFTDFLPLLALFLVPLWERYRGWQAGSRMVHVSFGVLIAVSVAVQAIGAFYYPSLRSVDWNRTPRDVDAAPERLWDWTDPQLLRLIRNGPRQFSFAPQG